MINIEDAILIYTPYTVLSAITDGEFLIISNNRGVFLDPKELTPYSNNLYEADSIMGEWVR